MASKIFLDANVVLDAVLQRKEHYRAERVLEAVISGNYLGYITSSVLHIVTYWTIKAMTQNEARLHLLLLLRSVDLIETDRYTAIKAIRSDMKDIEDAYQCFTALEHKLDYFISSDKKLKNAALPQLPVLSPGEFLNLKNPS